MAGAIRSAAMLSDAPIKIPPSSAPVRLPSPPTITVMKARSVKSTARNGCVSKIGVISAPAMPAQATPIPDVIAKTVGIRKPMAAAPVRLSAAARMACPKIEKRRKAARTAMTTAAHRAACRRTRSSRSGPSDMVSKPAVESTLRESAPKIIRCSPVIARESPMNRMNCAC
jgi:hypothetical protein